MIVSTYNRQLGPLMGCNFYYDNKLAQINGLANYSGTRANKEFWAHDQTDTEKEILRIKAIEK